MPSRFPGMDPYLEQRAVFHGFHQACILVISELLNAQLPAAFYTAVEVDVYIHELPADRRRLLGRADVATTRDTRSPGGAHAVVAVDQAPAYGLFPAAVDELPLNFLELRDAGDDQVVTVIEMLSPSNKYAGSDREKYLQKRHAIMRSAANLVEIDLLRGGPRLPLDGMIDCDYCALIARATERPRVGIWPMRLRERLPRVPIPLRDGYADLALELQDMVNLAFDRSGFVRRIYRGKPEPALRAEDAEWTEAFVPAEFAR